MDLEKLAIPRTFVEMQQVSETYYQRFYLEMVRIPNSSLSSYIDTFLETLLRISKNSSSHPNAIRASIGVVALYRFGYHNFPKLTQIIDRLLPQTDIEYVRFTSWCVGRLIHHPDVEQGLYVTHVFNRCVGWCRANGRRARPLAAAHLLGSLSSNAGSSVVVFFPSLQSIIWILVSHESTQVLRATADAICMYTRAVVRYGRSDLEQYLDFFTKLCTKLLNFNASLKNYTALILFEQLINNCPDYFLPKILEYYSLFEELDYDSPMLVKQAQFVAIAALSQVDPKIFVDNIADELFSNTESILFEFSKEIVSSLALLCRTIPDYMITKLTELKEFAKELITEPDSDFTLLTAMLNRFGKACLPIDYDLIKELIKMPMTQSYLQFFVALFSIPHGLAFQSSAADIILQYLQANNTIENSYENNDKGELIDILTERIKAELQSPDPIIALNLLSQLPPEVIVEQDHLLDEVINLFLSPSDEIRSLSPKAIYNIAKSSKSIKTEKITDNLLQLAIYDSSAQVRSSIINTVGSNCIELLALPDHIKYLEIFIGDDSITVRKATFKLMAELLKYNPLAITSLSRDALSDCFFYIRHALNVRQKARYIETLPDLINASKSMIKSYSGAIMDIVLSTLLYVPTSPNTKYENFMEEDAVNTILIGIMDSLSLVAPLDSGQVAHYGDILIPLICNILLTRNCRNLSLSIMQLFLSLLTFPGSDLSYRTKTPMILSACSTFLAKTRSRKARMRTLKVLGAIGVVEVHQKPPPKSCQSPKYTDEALAREFFHPSRDSDTKIDDSLLLKESSLEQYLVSFSASSLLSIFRDDNLKEFYLEVIQALVQVLHFPRMYMLTYFDNFVSRLLEVMEKSTDEEIKEILPLYTELIDNSTHNTSPFLKRSLDLIHNRFSNQLAIQFLDLVLAFLYSIRDGVCSYTPDSIQLLVRCLDESKNTNERIAKRVLSVFSILSVYSIELLFIIIPFICNTILCEQSLRGVRIAALETLTEIVKTVDLYKYLGPMIRAVTFGLFYEDDETGVTRKASYELLYALFQAQKTNFYYASKPLMEALQKSKMINPKLQSLIDEVKSMKTDDSKLFYTHERLYKFKPLCQPKRRTFYTARISNKIKHQFSEDTIIAKFHTPTTGQDRHMDQWIRSLILACISNSPIDQMRACTTLATSYHPLALKLFNVAFLSCWKETSPEGRETIVTSIRDILKTNDNYEPVMNEILGLLVFMDKIEQPLQIEPEIIVQASLKFGYIAYALHIQQGLLDKTPQNTAVIGQLVEILVQMKNWPDAIGVWENSQQKAFNNSSLNKAEVLSRLRFWDQVESIYRSKFNKSKDFQSFVNLTQALSEMAMFDQIIDHIEYFRTLKSHQKMKLAVNFGKAALQTGRWDLVELTLKYMPDDSVPGMALKAMNAIHKGNVEMVDGFIDKGFSLLASRPITFLADNQRVHPETMQMAQTLVEICEMKRRLFHYYEATDIDEVWNERLKTAPQDFDLWFHLLANRVRMIDARDDNLIKFFTLKSATLGTKIHSNVFDLLLPDFNFEISPDLHKICYVVLHWNVGEKQRALSEMKKLTTIVDPPLNSRCHFLYASWLLEGDENDSIDVIKDAFNHLKIVVDSFSDKYSSFSKISNPEFSVFSNSTSIDNFGFIVDFRDVAREVNRIKNKKDRRFQPLSIDLESPEVIQNVQKAQENCGTLILPSQILKELTTDQTVVEQLRKWSDVNASLISLDQDNFEDYVTNAINALTLCAKLSPSFPDVVQLLNIFFEHANEERIFKATASFIEALQPKQLIQATPQLLIQLSHPSEEVASFVHNTVLSLLKEHYHALIFSVIVMKHSTNKARGLAANKILEEFNSLKPQVYAEVELIRKSMLMAAVTWSERVLQYITDAFEHYQRNRIDRMLISLNSILKLVKKPKCDMHYQFIKQYGSSIQSLDQILKIFDPKIKNTMDQLSQWCKIMQDKIGEELKRVRVIRLSSISKELHEKTGFFMAVPCTYKPSKPVNHIQYFVGQFSVYMTKQQPKDVIIRGEDGNFYQYLLKGHEDLRLDERIMQFFRLINSLIIKSFFFQQNMIQTMGVIPLSLQHGLVQWVPGTETLRSIIEGQRKIHNRDPMEEYTLIDNFSDVPFDLLLQIQKLQLIKKIFKNTPDSDLASFFWLKASNAEMWMKQTSTFAISTGMTSIVGYIIGLGDRHPSNLLIDRFTGKVIHIDFGDCFERAARRALLPEVVPFRLTRMMVKAMGPTGVNGNFLTSFVNMSQILRENKRVLVMVLSTFVHEPLFDPDIEEYKKAALKTPPLIVMKAKAEEAAARSYHPAEEAGIQSSVEMRKRVYQKLTGNDLGDDQKLSVENQATKLINTASDPYILSRMYSGWCPFW